jgi:hypothetical protein
MTTKIIAPLRDKDKTSKAWERYSVDVDKSVKELQDRATTAADGSVTVTTASSGSNTVAVKIKSGYGIEAGTDGIKLKKGSHLADLAVVPDTTGADTISKAVLDAYLGSIRTKLNDLIARLETAEVLSSS